MAVDRLTEIIDLLQLERSCSIERLAKYFNVSKETIRRDVRQLEKMNKALKFHGGVRLLDSLLEPPYHKRINLNAEQKKAIGRKAVELVEDGMTIFIDSGSTSYWFAQSLVAPHNLQVITNSLEVANIILGRNNWRVILVGGQFDPEYRATFGHEAISQAQRFTPDILFFSIGAIDSQKGFLDFIIDEVDFKKALLPRAQKRIILPDETKFGHKGAIQLGSFEQFDTLICDIEPQGDLAQALKSAKIEVISTNTPSPSEN